MIRPESHTFDCKDTLVLESGKKLPQFRLRYHTWGKLNAEKSNVIWVCHALTAGSDVSLWWPGLVGPGCLYDPDEYFIVCANMLGGCYGSTGPLSLKPDSGRPYFHSFPGITNRDIVACFERLRAHLQIEHLHTLIGGSLGGQQAMEWSVSNPTVPRNLILLATNARHSPWGIAFNESQRMAIEQDITWQLNTPGAGINGLKVARSLALLSYRHYEAYEATQTDADDEVGGYRAAGYQRYQGEKLVARGFNAYTYWHLSKAMDSHNVGRMRGGIPSALARIEAATLVIGIDTDILFPAKEQKELARLIPEAQVSIIHSDFGHDGFLLETACLTECISNFYQAQPNREMIPS